MPFCAAPSAFLCGFCLVRSTINHFDFLYLAVMVLFGVSLIFDLFWTRREVQRLAADETAKKRMQLNFCGLVFSSVCFPLVWVWRCQASSGFWHRFHPDAWRGLLEPDHGRCDLPGSPRCEKPCRYSRPNAGRRPRLTVAEAIDPTRMARNGPLKRCPQSGPPGPWDPLPPKNCGCC